MFNMLLGIFMGHVGRENVFEGKVIKNLMYAQMLLRNTLALFDATPFDLSPGGRPIWSRLPVGFSCKENTGGKDK